MKYIKLYESHADYKNNLVNEKVNVSYDYSHIHITLDYNNEYLTFLIIEYMTLSFSGTGLSYSLDKGETWISYTSPITLWGGDYIMFKGTMTPTGSSTDLNNRPGIGTFSTTGKFIAFGNPMSLLFGDNFKGQKSLTGKSFAFSNLFASALLVSCKNIALPATTLSLGCYYCMFGHTLIDDVPFLPATSLYKECYRGLLNACYNLTEVPQDMLSHVTTLAELCYCGLFMNSYIKVAPNLPNMTLPKNCYSWMFHDCPKLERCVLPALTLSSGCYSQLFYNCTSLNYIKAMFTTTPSTTYTSSWVYGVSATGTFVKNAAAEWDVAGTQGIPTGWTIETAES